MIQKIDWFSLDQLKRSSSFQKKVKREKKEEEKQPIYFAQIWHFDDEKYDQDVKIYLTKKKKYIEGNDANLLRCK